MLGRLKEHSGGGKRNWIWSEMFVSAVPQSMVLTMRCNLSEPVRLMDTSGLTLVFYTWYALTNIHAVQAKKLRIVRCINFMIMVSWSRSYKREISVHLSWHHLTVPSFASFSSDLEPRKTKASVRHRRLWGIQILRGDLHSESISSRRKRKFFLFLFFFNLFPHSSVWFVTSWL